MWIPFYPTITLKAYSLYNLEILHERGLNYGTKHGLSHTSSKKDFAGSSTINLG